MMALTDRYCIVMGERTPVAHQDLVNFIELLSCNPHVWSWEPPKVENPVEHCHRFRTKLPVDVLFINNNRILNLIKAKRKVGCA